VIVFNLSGHGLLDLTGYEKYLTGQLKNHSLPQEEIDKYIAPLAGYPKPQVPVIV